MRNAKFIAVIIAVSILTTFSVGVTARAQVPALPTNPSASSGGVVLPPDVEEVQLPMSPEVAALPLCDDPRLFTGVFDTSKLPPVDEKAPLKCRINVKVYALKQSKAGNNASNHSFKFMPYAQSSGQYRYAGSLYNINPSGQIVNYGAPGRVASRESVTERRIVAS